MHTVAIHVHVLASDAYQGRNNDTVGSGYSQNYIITQLKNYGATGLETSKTGDDTFKQTFNLGTNIVGVIPGSELPNEYVIVGGHYDHLGSNCRGTGVADAICNGATDNAAGAAATIEVGRAISQLPGGPRRSVVIALWDREEDGLLGSAYYVAHPLVPLNQTIAYVNFDIQGANLLPSLRNSSFAVGAETGGARLTAAVQTAVGSTTLNTHLVSSIFGQGRSDYVNFTGAQIPNVFFSDSTGPCYHTVKDEVGVVDWGKLAKQTDIATKVTEDLVAGAPPAFVPNTPLATFADAVSLNDVVQPGHRRHRPIHRHPARTVAAVPRRPQRGGGGRCRSVRRRGRRRPARRRGQRGQPLDLGRLRWVLRSVTEPPSRAGPRARYPAVVDTSGIPNIERTSSTSSGSTFSGAPASNGG